jgi:signal transduction histidine kinase/CheY-like chemotaxis protein
VSVALLSVTVAREHDVVGARQRARHLAALLGFDAQDQTRIATAVSEIARNAVGYAGGGRVAFAVEGQTRPQVFTIRITDRGPGIADLDAILGGRYESATGMGLGIVGAKRLMDAFEIDSAPGRGTAVTLRKLMPRRAELVTPAAAGRIAAALAQQAPRDAVEEVQQQNQELLRMLDELRRRQDDLVRLNAELEDTNRGVVALYAELDEKADHLRRADELKSRFLSNMSHEFRTPLNSILALSRLLLDRADGPLTREQETQITFVRRAAEDLFELVNDLLDTAKIEAGKIIIRPVEFTVENLFGALRGMLRPLLVNEALALVFEDASGLPPLNTDEAKVSQILRNFISNALKFTERGEVRVAARLTGDARGVVFSVADTGIGIAPEDREVIFQEFTQVESRLQARVKGTGLGLPLTRRLAELLGGSVAVDSAPGVGSTFSATIPLAYAPPSTARADAPVEVEWRMAPGKVPILVLEDNPDAVLVYETLLRESEFQLVHARSVAEARRAVDAIEFRAAIVDILLRGEDAWAFLAELTREEATRDLPVIVISDVDDHAKALALGARAYAPKPVDRAWLLESLRAFTAGRRRRQILIIDDDPVARYLLRGVLRDVPCAITEAAGGAEGLTAARRDRPDVIICDVVMPDVSGFDVLRALSSDPATRDIPIVMNTAKVLTAEESRQLSRAAAVLTKESYASGSAAAEVRKALQKVGFVA